MAEDATSNADDDKNDWIASGEPSKPKLASQWGKCPTIQAASGDSQMDLNSKITYNQ
jgi:hypothetical protein